MKPFSMFREARASAWSYGPQEPAVGVTSRRRVMVFCGVFLLAAAVGLAYTFARPAQYRAAARLEISPPAALAAAPAMATEAGGVVVAAPSPAAPAEPVQPLLGQIQVLTSRPLLERTLARLQEAGKQPAGQDAQAVDHLQGQVGATAIEGTKVVELWAVGPDAAALPAIVNTLVAVYREHMADAYRGSSADSLEKIRGEAARLEQEVTAKRAQVRDYQLRYNIVSMERDEQALLARTRLMNTTLAAANERAVKAEAQVRSLQESAEAGRLVARPKDNPTLAAIEHRASILREELRELERSYAPAYLAMDPQARAKRARLAELEDQLQRERASSQNSAIAEAQAELASARGAVARMQQQMAEDRRGVQEFSLHFNEYKALQGEVSQLEALRREARERVVRLEASESLRQPGVEVIEWAVEPGEVWFPRYGRDAAISVGAAFGLALFSVWLVEYLRPRPVAPTMVAPAWMPFPVPLAAPGLAGALAGPQPVPALAAAEPGRLPAPASLPRELTRDEVASLLEAASGPARVAAAALLAGADREELAGLVWEDVDRDAGVLRVGGSSGRALPLAGALRAALEAAGLDDDPPPAGPLLRDAQGRALGSDEVEGLLLCAAHDAGLDAPVEVTAAALRHTYLAYLVRQGVRFADLPAVVGSLPAAVLGAYSHLAPVGQRLAAGEVEWVYPGEASGDRLAAL